MLNYVLLDDVFNGCLFEFQRLQVEAVSETKHFLDVASSSRNFHDMIIADDIVMIMSVEP